MRPSVGSVMRLRIFSSVDCAAPQHAAREAPRHAADAVAQRPVAARGLLMADDVALADFFDVDDGVGHA